MYLVTFLILISLFVILFQHDYFETAISPEYIPREKKKKKCSYCFTLLMICDGSIRSHEDPLLLHSDINRF